MIFESTHFPPISFWHVTGAPRFTYGSTTTTANCSQTTGDQRSVQSGPQLQQQHTHTDQLRSRSKKTVARNEKRHAEAEERAALTAAWEKCNPGRVCTVANLKCCVTCGVITKRKCRSQVFKAARDAAACDAAAPLALPAP